jgi:hypothetical protein
VRKEYDLIDRMNEGVRISGRKHWMIEGRRKTE